MKKITIIISLLFITLLFIFPQLYGKSPKTSIEQRIVVSLSNLIEISTKDALNTIKKQINNNTENLSNKDIDNLNKKFKAYIYGDLEQLSIYKDIVINNNYDTQNLNLLNSAQNLIDNIETELNEIYNLNPQKDKQLIESKFNKINESIIGFKQIKSSFAKKMIIE